MDAQVLQWRGDLRWSIKESFFGYIERSGGRVELQGVRREETDFVFRRVPEGHDDDLRHEADGLHGTIRFMGGFHVVAHGGLLDIAFHDPVVDIHGGDAMVHVLTGDGQPLVPFAMVALGEPIEREEGVAEWVGGEARLTPEGSRLFSEMYQPYTDLDPIALAVASARALE